MDIAATLERLAKLREHAGPPTQQPREPIDSYTIKHEQNVRKLLYSWNVDIPPVSEGVVAAWKCQIVKHRVSMTTSSRILDIIAYQTMANSSLAAITLRTLFERLYRLFESVRERLPSWLPEEVDTDRLRDLCHRGNQRQHFQMIRSLLGPLRTLLRRLSRQDEVSRAMLKELGELGVIVPDELHFFVSTAAFGDTEEILSPPEHFRRLWKPVAKERIAPEDGERPGKFTKQRWQTNMRVQDCAMPPVSAMELEELFGAHATFASHGDQLLPFDCGAYKYYLVEDDPFVVDCTEKGLYTTSGPSGTAYRYLNLWIVLGGSKQKLPEVRFAVAALSLAGFHHSLMEILVVCAPIIGCEPPQNLKDMVEQLVPHKLELTWGGKPYSFTPEAFNMEICRSLDRWLA